MTRFGVSRSLMLRLLENFFRRWWLYLVPVVVLGVFGAITVAGSKSKFQSTGTFNVESSTVLSTLSGSTDQNFGYDTPAGATSKRINSLLQTDQFIKDVATRAKLSGALNSGQITVGKIRASLVSYANGGNLVGVTAKSDNAAVAEALAGATIDSFVQSIIDSAASQSTAAVAFFGDLVKTYQANVDKARQALDAYTTAHPAPVTGARPDDQAGQVSRLTADLTHAQDEYNGALNKMQDAQLSTQQTKADVGQRMRIVDAPQLPSAPQGKLKSMAMSMLTFLILGGVLSIAAVVVATLLDHTVRCATDVKERLGARLLGIVPESGLSLAVAASGPAPTRSAKPSKVAAKAVDPPKPVAKPADRMRSAPARPQRSSARMRTPGSSPHGTTGSAG